MTSTRRSWAAKVGLVGLWILIVLEALFMALAGWSKFANPGGWMSMFEGWGYPAWFALVIGAGELGLGILVLVPRLTAYASMGLFVIMGGALATVLAHPGGRMGPEPPLIHLVVLAVLIWARWGVRWRPNSVDSDERA